MLKDHLAYRMEKHQRRVGGRRKAYGNAGRGTIWTDAAGGYDPSKSDAGKENPVICEELTISTNTLKNIF